MERSGVVRREKRMRVIIIDDEPYICKTIGNVMERIGWECMIMTDGAGLDAYLEKFAPDLVITDYHLPGENGIEIAMKVKERGIPCIILTGFPRSRVTIEEQGIKWLQKPVTPDLLRREVEKILSSAPPSSPGR